MSPTGLLRHPDRVHRLERAGDIDVSGESHIDHYGMPLDTLAHWQRVNAQSRLIVQTTTALETQLVETDIDESVTIDKIGTTHPFYCAFAQFGSHDSLYALEGAYINPVSRHAKGQLQIAYIPRVSPAARFTNDISRIQASRIERLDMPAGFAVNAHSQGVHRIAGNTNTAQFDAARAQLLRIMLVMRLDHIDRRKRPAEPSPRHTRLVPRFDRLEIGPDDLRYGIDERTVVSGCRGIHQFRRGRFVVNQSRLGWRKPGLTIVDRTALLPTDIA